LSLGASGAIGKSIVFFNWKGLDVAREYVVPSNPKTDPQTTQRDYLKAAITLLRTAQAHVVFPMLEIDTMAYSLWGSVFATPRTWFNQWVKNFIDQNVASLSGNGCGGCTITEVADEVDIDVYNYTGDVTAGVFKYGTSKTALIHSKAAVVAGQKLSCDITSLETGVKYYIQFEATAPAGQVGVKSGIYYGTPI
jgi:hypothetical protein